MKKRSIKILSIIFACVLLMVSVNFNTTAKAATEETDTEIARYTIEIHEYPSDSEGSSLARAVKTKTVTKTIQSENAAGEAMWTLTLTATFYYNGTTSVCSQASASSKSYSSGWTVTTPSCGKTENRAWATSTATNKKLNVTDTQTAVIRCSKTGVIS